MPAHREANEQHISHLELNQHGISGAGELEQVGESALFELAQVAGATFSTAELYRLAELILGQAYERERRAGVL